jgi:hypothetical protein
VSIQRSSFFVLACAALAGAGCVVSVDSQGHIVRDQRQFAVTGTPEIRMTTFDGAIEIRSWDRSEVVIDIEKRGPTAEAVGELEVTAVQDGHRIQVEVRRPSGERGLLGIGLNMSRSAKLVASVPRQVNLMARTGDGSILAERLTGRLELRTGDGSVRGTGLEGELSVHTGDGSVTLEGVDGRLQLVTGDGGVSVAGRFSVVQAETADGSITLRAEPGSAMAEDWSVSSGDGGITLYLPGAFDAMLDARTGDGRIRSDLDVAGASSERRERRSLRGRLGAGGRTLRIRTGDGSISLRQ